PRALGAVQTHRAGAHRLREAAPPGRLLPDAAARERRGLVAQARFLSAHPDLDQDVVGAFNGRVEIAGHFEPALETLAREHPLRHAADDLATLGVDVLEDELADVEAG